MDQTVKPPPQPRRRGLAAVLGPPQPEDVLREYPRREIMLGLGVIGAFLLIIVGWGALARLDAAVYAPGQIVVAGNRQAVQHRDGGIVTELDVHEGDRVKTGQVLLRLNADELRANERATADQTIQLKALQARLIAELRGARAIAFPPEFASLTGEDRAAADAAMQIQRREFSARADALSTGQAVLAQREKQLNEQILGYRGQVAANQRQQALIQEEMSGLDPLVARGLVPKTRMRSLQRNAAELTGSFGEYSANIAASRQSIGESRLRSVDLERERAADISKEYRDAEMQLSQAQPKLIALREQIGRTEVRAPATGRVVGLTVFTVGGVVAAGQKLADVVPEDQPLVLEAKVKPQDADDLRVGQKTEIRISAFHDRGLPLLTGFVSKVSADSFTDEKTGVSFFKMEVTVPASQLKVISDVRGAESGLKPGLPVEVVVPLRRRSALDYLVEPLKHTLWKSFREN